MGIVSFSDRKHPLPPEGPISSCRRLRFDFPRIIFPLAAVDLSVPFADEDHFRCPRSARLHKAAQTGADVVLCCVLDWPTPLVLGCFSGFGFMFGFVACCCSLSFNFVNYLCQFYEKHALHLVNPLASRGGFLNTFSLIASLPAVSFRFLDRQNRGFCLF